MKIQGGISFQTQGTANIKACENKKQKNISAVFKELKGGYGGWFKAS